MKLEIFDYMLWTFGIVITIVVAIEVVTWVVREVRTDLLLRRLRRRGVRVRWLPRPNAGFQVSGQSSAARRHHVRDDELGMLTHLGWGQVQHRNPPADAGSRKLRERKESAS